MKSISSTLSFTEKQENGNDILFQSGIITHWKDIVGNDIGKHTMPVKLSYTANLTLGMSAQQHEMLQKKRTCILILKLYNPSFVLTIKLNEQLIIERVNTYIGESLISSISCNI
ncbi:hypothetical protein Fsol_00553 [Candidatus Fokinia solitaria]|uniref:Uncharacterized protein n=1 Tax=Candidatus Fokinia solitaria TaxID=1802984 RepID=A0A2U8BSM5_9RICK|nr:DciA family protein [Candidatus Fokinia solitaria]AWD33341.1 hypothetical protein Fsol_00553 [Candidatus Fokinia solitaria]